MEVQIFIKVCYGAHKKKSIYAACILFTTPKGIKVKRYYYGNMDKTTGYENVILIALVESMQHLTKPCSITAYTRTQYIKNMLNRGSPGKWERNRWRNAKGKPVACAEQWKSFLRLLDIHNLEFEEAQNNEYTAEMDKVLKKMKEELRDGFKESKEE